MVGLAALAASTTQKIPNSGMLSLGRTNSPKDKAGGELRPRRKTWGDWRALGCASAYVGGEMPQIEYS